MPTLPTYRIDPYDLRLFIAATEQGSITAGARQLHLSLAAASSRLQRLEHALGTPLLRRSRQGVSLTDAGHTLLRHAGRLQREMEHLHAEMAAHAHGVRSTVRLLCNTAAMTEHLPALLGRFLVDRPMIDIELGELASVDVLAAMRQARADIGIVADHVATQGLATLPFRDDSLVVVVPAGLAGKDQGQGQGHSRGKRRTSSPAAAPLSWPELLARPFVGLPAESGLSRFLQQQALQHGRGLHHRVRVHSLEAVLGLVADGVGVAVVPARAAQRLANPRVQVHPLAEPWARRQLLLCTDGSSTLGAGAAALLAFLATAATVAAD